MVRGLLTTVNIKGKSVVIFSDIQSVYLYTQEIE